MVKWTKILVNRLPMKVCIPHNSDLRVSVIAKRKMDCNQFSDVLGI